MLGNFWGFYGGSRFCQENNFKIEFLWPKSLDLDFPVIRDNKKNNTTGDMLYDLKKQKKKLVLKDALSTHAQKIK